MTPTPNPLYDRLFVAASQIVDRITHHVPVTLDDYADLAAAVRAIDDEQFSDWWERDRAEKAQRTAEAQS
jgi:hypothetical protein